MLCETSSPSSTYRSIKSSRSLRRPRFSSRDPCQGLPDSPASLSAANSRGPPLRSAPKPREPLKLSSPSECTDALDGRGRATRDTPLGTVASSSLKRCNCVGRRLIPKFAAPPWYSTPRLFAGRGAGEVALASSEKFSATGFWCAPSNASVTAPASDPVGLWNGNRRLFSVVSLSSDTFGKCPSSTSFRSACLVGSRRSRARYSCRPMSISMISPDSISSTSTSRTEALMIS
mmetsp:Transcript_26028/g.83000  ORF Transcript_26028/g.83000 Transcript_26028/m.83000 type:complete len:232 (+) Transcript_26028:2751-3446(+)